MEPPAAERRLESGEITSSDGDPLAVVERQLVVLEVADRVDGDEETAVRAHKPAVAEAGFEVLEAVDELERAAGVRDPDHVVRRRLEIVDAADVNLPGLAVAADENRLARLLLRGG